MLLIIFYLMFYFTILKLFLTEVQTVELNKKERESERQTQKKKNEWKKRQTKKKFET